MADDTLALARSLIRFPSITPDDAGCQDLLAERLEAWGFRCERMPGHPVVYGDWLHAPDKPTVLVYGHYDVQPADPLEEWDTPPFDPTVRGEMLYGRGTADMKGSLAAMLVATRRFLQRHPRPAGSLALLVTSDEEGPAIDGTARVIETLRTRGEHIDWCLVGEPSSRARLGDVVRVGRRGSLNATLRVRGIQGHVAYPETARNPVHEALPVLAELAAHRWDGGNDFFPPTSFQISNIEAGTGATNVVPGTCTVQFNFRFSTEQSDSGLREAVHARLDAARLDYDIDWHLSGRPFLTASGPLVEAVRAALRARGVEPELSTGGGTSDGRFIAPAGAEVVELGPCNATIHQIDEHVSVADLEALSDLYDAILERMLGDG